MNQESQIKKNNLQITKLKLQINSKYKNLKPFVSINNITIRNGSNFFFEDTSWAIHTGEQWLIYGQNGSGKSTLAKAIAGILPLKHGEIILHFIKNHIQPYPSVHRNTIAYLSFETQENFLKNDSLQRDFESYIGVEKRGEVVEEYLFESGITNHEAIKNKLRINELLNREIITLSTGEMRKVFLMKAFLQKPKLLILDEPFDGLDADSKEDLMQHIDAMMEEIQIILIVHRKEEIPERITHILMTKESRIVAKGKKEKMVKKLFYSSREIESSQLRQGYVVHGSVQNKDLARQSLSEGGSTSLSFPSNNKMLIEMKDVTVQYGDKVILDKINWTVREGENWAIVGPNGAGKSTLVHLITGDHQQAYANSIKLFGKTKDDRVSMWEVKEKIGIVSTDLMLKYQKEMNAYNVVLSGFFDSVGLYKETTEKQRKQADYWIEALSVKELIVKQYQQLSFGQKRLVLIARAIVKSPTLLILDEPCHGLDRENRKRVLERINYIGRSEKTNILLITHSTEEIIPCITHLLKLEKGRIL